MPLILTAEELRKVDANTIVAEGISSLELMERAAGACADAVEQYLRHDFPFTQPPLVVLCGRGNNGGDGWVLARLLNNRGYAIEVIDFTLGAASTDNLANRKRAAQLAIFVHTLVKGESLPPISKAAVVIDAVFGTGLNRPVTGEWGEVFAAINGLPNQIWSVDIPSGVFTDQPTTGTPLRSNRCFSLGYPKLAEFAAGNDRCYDQLHHVDFQLAAAEELVAQRNVLLTQPQVGRWLKKRKRSGHKGTYGHALLVAGSHGSIGAAVLAARATLRAGAGKLTCHLPACGYQIMQTSVPEAMCITDAQDQLITAIGKTKPYTTAGIGPGIGQAALTVEAIHDFLTRVDYPIVVDADALNILANNLAWLSLLPKGSILTPHPKEFDRLFGPHDHAFARWVTQREKARALDCIIVLKGGYTTVADVEGTLSFNPTGNPGMGSAGMGDALTGIITGLLAQGYAAEVAARLGVYLHGLAGDLVATAGAAESLIASDVVAVLGQAFTELRK